MTSLQKGLTVLTILILILAVLFIWIAKSGRTSGKLLTYRVPGQFSIQYPEGWVIQTSPEPTGMEIVALYNFINKRGSGYFKRGQLKIGISIFDKELKSLDQIVTEQYGGTKSHFIQEKLIVDGREAIRIRGELASDQLTPVVELFIDYQNDKYVSILGYYNGGPKLVKQIEKVQESFRKL